MDFQTALPAVSQLACPGAIEVHTLLFDGCYIVRISLGTMLCVLHLLRMLHLLLNALAAAGAARAHTFIV